MHNVAYPMKGSSGVAKLNEYLTVGEAAELIGVSRDTLRRWDRAGKLKAHRHPITGYRLYVRKDLFSLLLSTRSKLKSSDTVKKKRRRA